MSDKLVERAKRSLTRLRDSQVINPADASIVSVNFGALCDVLCVVPEALESLTIPQTDLEQRAREMLAAEYAAGGFTDFYAVEGSYLAQCSIRAITKALASSSVPEQDSWQPIETAKTGDGVILIGYGQYRELDGPSPAFMRWYDGDYPGWYVNALPFYPTHWMPLPPPPAVSGPQDRGASQEDGRS